MPGEISFRAFVVALTFLRVCVFVMQPQQPGTPTKARPIQSDRGLRQNAMQTIRFVETAAAKEFRSPDSLMMRVLSTSGGMTSMPLLAAASASLAPQPTVTSASLPLNLLSQIGTNACNFMLALPQHAHLRLPLTSLLSTDLPARDAAQAFGVSSATVYKANSAAGQAAALESDLFLSYAPNTTRERIDPDEVAALEQLLLA